MHTITIKTATTAAAERIAAFAVKIGVEVNHINHGGHAVDKRDPLANPAYGGIPEGCHIITDDQGIRRLSRMTQEEYNNWQNQTSTSTYAGFKITAKKDFGQHGYYDSKTRTNLREGWNVLFTEGKYRGCQAMPGAAWAYTEAEAMRMINAFIAAGGDSNSDTSLDDSQRGVGARFHALLQLTKAD